MIYKGRVKGSIIILNDGVSLPEGAEVVVIPTIKQGAVGIEALQERTAIGMKMRAFSERISGRGVDLSDLILEARQELDGRG